nr:hypothetical protein [Tanacetum cinerariifolium]
MLLRHTVGVQRSIRKHNKLAINFIFIVRRGVSKTDRRPDRTEKPDRADRTEVISIRSSVHPFPYFRSAVRSGPVRLQERGFWKRLLAGIHVCHKLLKSYRNSHCLVQVYEITVVVGITKTSNVHEHYSELVDSAQPNVRIFLKLYNCSFKMHPVQRTPSDNLVQNSTYDPSSERFMVPSSTTVVFVET